MQIYVFFLKKIYFRLFRKKAPYVVYKGRYNKFTFFSREKIAVKEVLLSLLNFKLWFVVYRHNKLIVA